MIAASGCPKSSAIARGLAPRVERARTWVACLALLLGALGCERPEPCPKGCDESLGPCAVGPYRVPDKPLPPREVRICGEWRHRHRSCEETEIQRLYRQCYATHGRPASERFASRRRRPRLKAVERAMDTCMAEHDWYRVERLP